MTQADGLEFAALRMSLQENALHDLSWALGTFIMIGCFGSVAMP